jgi:hypothetical protein
MSNGAGDKKSLGLNSSLVCEAADTAQDPTKWSQA